MPKESKEQRQRKNKARKEALKARKEKSYRRRNKIAPDEEEVAIAPLWRRTVQFCIDQTMLGLFALFTYATFALTFDLTSLPPLLAIAPQLIFGLGYIVPAMAMRGQTFGMKKLQLMVLNKEGTSIPNKLQSVIRWFILFGIPNSYFMVQPTTDVIENMVYVAILSISTTLVIVSPILITKKRTGLHDLISGTMMVKLPNPEK